MWGVVVKIHTSQKRTGSQRESHSSLPRRRRGSRVPACFPTLETKYPPPIGSKAGLLEEPSAHGHRASRRDASSFSHPRRCSRPRSRRPAACELTCSETATCPPTPVDAGPDHDAADVEDAGSREDAFDGADAGDTSNVDDRPDRSDIADARKRRGHVAGGRRFPAGRRSERRPSRKRRSGCERRSNAVGCPPRRSFLQSRRWSITDRQPLPRQRALRRFRLAGGKRRDGCRNAHRALSNDQPRSSSRQSRDDARFRL